MNFMMKKINIILLFTLILGLLLFTSTLSAYTINSIDIDEEYNYKDSDPYHIIIDITLDGNESSPNIPLTINSDYQPTVINFNTERSDHTANFYLDFESFSSSWEGGISDDWPKIIVNDIDTITVTDGNGNSDTMRVDNVSPNIGTFTISSLGTNYNDYYRGDVNLNLSGYSDTNRYLDNFIVYVVETDNLDFYDSDYIRKIDTDDNSTQIYLESSTLPDANYFVLVDAIDASGNVGISADVKNTKKILYTDNTEPGVTRFRINESIKSLSNNEIYYVNSFDFNFDIQLEDPVSSIKNGTLTGFAPDGSYIDSKDFNSDISGFSHHLFSEYLTVDTYHIYFDVNDYVNNLSHYDFNIQIDSNAPTTPTVPTLTRAVDNNITVSAWGVSTDDGSGLKYQIYRSTSTFTDVTTQTLVCTLTPTAPKTCLDTDSKSQNTRYYYGVSAVDNAGNKSAVISVSVKTGPELTVDIDFDYSTYVKETTPEINLECGSDVNAVRLSCNGTTFTAWDEITSTTTVYDTFNITSGNGCTTTQGLKTIYVEARSEDDPFTVTRESLEIKYDSQAPTVPSNVVATAQTNGSVKITWNESTDINGSGVEEYKIYYSQQDDVSTSSSSFLTSDTEYIYKPNLDATFYFKLISIDRLGNESVLSTGVSGATKRFGPSFTYNVNPKNIVNDIYYIKKGNITFTVTSSQELKQTPTIRIKVGTGAYQNIPASYNNLITTASYDFQTSGAGVLEITGINNSNESTIDSFSFVVDATTPVFDVNYIFSDENKYFSFSINNFSEDVFRVQYLLNNNEEICFINDSNNNYLCEFDSTVYPDASMKIYVLASDLAFNYTTQIVDFEINNIDEQLVLKQTLIANISKNKALIEDTMLFLTDISLEVSADIITKFDLVKEKITEATSFEDFNNFTSAVESYTVADDLLSEIIEILPKETVLKTKNLVIDFKNHGYDFNTVILDQNTINDNLFFYDINNTDLNGISVSRELSIFEISNLNFYSSVLTFDNNTDSNITISFIEFVPKEFSKSATAIYFDRDITVIDDDPIILYNITIPPKSSVSTRYIGKEAVTSFDSLTKFDLINYSPSLLLTGFVTKDILNLSVPLFSTKSLFLISVVFLVIIVVLILIWMLASSRKKKDAVFTSLGPKETMNNYLGDKIGDKNTSENSNSQDNSKSDIEKKGTFDNNYEFILNAVKRENK